MTFRVTLYAHQAFLSMIKRTLVRIDKWSEKIKFKFEVEETATCIILCQTALESFLNDFYKEVIATSNYDDFEKKNFMDKINFFYEEKNKKPDWDKGCLQSVKKINSIRNWLIHFKDGNIGLISSTHGWVLDKNNKTKVYDFHNDLKVEKVKKYYNDTRRAMNQILELYEYDSFFPFDSIKTEKYEPYLVG